MALKMVTCKVYVDIVKRTVDFHCFFFSFCFFLNYKCSTSCGTGLQKRNRFCVRTQVKSIKTSRSPRRKGEIVDNIYCQNITVPHLSPQRKYCFRRNCNPPKWVAFPWSRVSVAFFFSFSFFLPIFRYRPIE